MKQYKAVCYTIRDNGRSVTVARAMAAGMKRHGWAADVRQGWHCPEGDLAIGYGWAQRRVFEGYKAAGGHFLYVDMGYWDRKPKGNVRGGYHKVVLDGWCPSAHMRRGMPADRLRSAPNPVMDSRASAGCGVIIAGMSSKSAADHGYAPNGWELQALEVLRRAGVPAADIFYRPKPSWSGATALGGCGLADVLLPIEQVLQTARALVTHHSNTAVDCLFAGVPFYAKAGVAKSLSAGALESAYSSSAAPYADRIALLRDIAYLQWTPAEMSSGACWDYYRQCLSM